MKMISKTETTFLYYSYALHGLVGCLWVQKWRRSAIDDEDDQPDEGFYNPTSRQIFSKSMYAQTQVIVGGSPAWQWTSSEIWRCDPRCDIFYLVFLCPCGNPCCVWTVQTTMSVSDLQDSIASWFEKQKPICSWWDWLIRCKKLFCHFLWWKELPN